MLSLLRDNIRRNFSNQRFMAMVGIFCLGILSAVAGLIVIVCDLITLALSALQSVIVGIAQSPPPGAGDALAHCGLHRQAELAEACALALEVPALVGHLDFVIVGYLLNGRRYVPVTIDDFLPCTHPRFGPGVEVYIDESIRERWPTHPLAGKVARACQGEYSPLLDSFADLPHHTTRVPVEAFEPTPHGNMYYYIPEQYVRLAAEQR
jgi:hypothetical protein